MLLCLSLQVWGELFNIRKGLVVLEEWVSFKTALRFMSLIDLFMLQIHCQRAWILSASSAWPGGGGSRKQKRGREKKGVAEKAGRGKERKGMKG